MRTTVVALGLLGLGSLAVESGAWADQISPPTARAPEVSGLTFSAAPLLFPTPFFGDLLPLRDAAGSTVATERVDDPELQALLLGPDVPTVLHRVTVPLADGVYQLGAGGRQLTISSTPSESRIDVTQVPDVSTFRMRIAGSEQYPQLYLTRDASGRATDIHRLDLTPQGADPVRYFVSSAPHDFIVPLYARAAILEARFCAQITGVAFDGTRGPTRDLGCIDPRDLADPRVAYTEAEGCSTGGAPSVLGLVAVMGLVIGRRRRCRPRPS